MHALLHRGGATLRPPRFAPPPARRHALRAARRAARPCAARKPEVREEVLGRVERAPSPAWATFAGAAGGVWSGSVVAASPFTGAVEALALDADGKPTVTGAWTRRVSARVGVAGDGALQETLWWRLADGAAAQGGGGGGGAAAAFSDAGSYDALGASALREGQPGLVVWEDGSFSDGPLSLNEAAATSARANPGWGIDPSELDPEEAEDLLLQQLRVRAIVETWDGPPPLAAAPPDALPPPPPPGASPPPLLAAQARSAPAAAGGGEWLAFVRAAAPLPPDAADVAAALEAGLPPPPPRFAHEAYEQRLVFSIPAGRPYPPEGLEDDSDSDADVSSGGGDGRTASHAAHAAHATGVSADEDEDDVAEEEEEEEGEDGDVGSAVWLPGGVVASVELGSGPARDGVTLRAGWALPREGLVWVEREYDGEGRLREVRHVSAARPGADGRGAGGA